MSPTEVEERGRQFDATLDVDHSGVAERRLVIDIFIFPNDWMTFANSPYPIDNEHDNLGTKWEFDYCCSRELLQFITLTIMNMINFRQMDILLIIAGSFCSSWIRNISTGRERRLSAWLSCKDFLDVYNNGDDRMTLVLLLEIWWWWWNRGQPVTLGFSFN